MTLSSVPRAAAAPAADVAKELLARSAARPAAPAAGMPSPKAPPRTPTATPAPAPAAAATAPADSALRLLQFEAEVRRVRGQPALLAHLVNEVRALVPYGQAIVWQRRRLRARWRPLAVSGLAAVDPHTALLESIAHRLSGHGTLDEPTTVDLHDAATAPRMNLQKRNALQHYPLPHGLWVPLPDRNGGVDAGVLFLRQTAFSAGAGVLLGRLGETYAHAWSAMDSRRRVGQRRLRFRWLAAGSVLALCALGTVPVPLSVMAPAEVVAAQPNVLTAPINGVVKSINVAPGTLVKAGDTLVVFEDIQPRNEMLLAQQRLAVAQARNARVTATAFENPEAAHELATSQAEYAWARVNYDYAREVLARTTLRAPRDGVVIYTDRREWEGRAVQVGEEILQVANPAQVAVRVDLATANGADLGLEARAEVFLDHAPLGGLAARVQYTSYTPRTLPGGNTAYTVMLLPAAGATARIGARGTARLYGPEVPLAVQLLRRPLSSLRQSLGV